MPSVACRGAARVCGTMDMVEDITDDTQHELDSTLGVLFIGFMLSIVLYGLSTFQMHVYFTRYPKDGRRWKTLVLLIWFIDTAASTLISRMQYYYLIDRFSASFQELEITNVFLAENALAGFAVLIVHSFYAFRVWTVSDKSVVVSGMILVTAIASFVFSIIATAKLTKQHFMAQLLTPEIEMVLGITSGCSIISNLLIVVSQVYYLRPSRKPHIRYPSNFLPRAVLVLATRGIGFTLLHIALLATLVSLPRSQIWVFLHFIISKVYINSFFAVLNTRTPVNGRGINEEDDANISDASRQFSALVFHNAHNTSATRTGPNVTFDLTQSEIASVRSRSNSAVAENSSQVADVKEGNHEELGTPISLVEDKGSRTVESWPR